MIRKIVMFACLLAFPSLKAQDLPEKPVVCEVSLTADGKREVSGFVPFASKSDERIFANTLLWAVSEICTHGRDAVTAQDVEGRTFACDWAIASLPGSGKKNVYRCKAYFRVAGGKLLYTLSQVMVESEVLVVKKLTSMDRLQPDTKRGHKEIIDDFGRAASAAIGTMCGFVVSHDGSDISHWREITAHQVVRGMSEDEVLLSVGKPLLVAGSGEVQWKYSDSFYVFMQDGRVKSVLK